VARIGILDLVLSARRADPRIFAGHGYGSSIRAGEKRPGAKKISPTEVKGLKMRYKSDPTTTRCAISRRALPQAVTGQLARDFRGSGSSTPAWLKWLLIAWPQDLESALRSSRIPKRAGRNMSIVPHPRAKLHSPRRGLCLLPGSPGGAHHFPHRRQTHGRPRPWRGLSSGSWAPTGHSPLCQVELSPGQKASVGVAGKSLAGSHRLRFHSSTESDILASTRLTTRSVSPSRRATTAPATVPSTRQLAMQTGLHRTQSSKVYRPTRK